MTLVLNSAQQARFAAAARALLSPLDLASIDHWRTDVLQHLAALVEADFAGFLLPVPGTKPYTLWNLPDEFGREFIEREGGVETFAPMVQRLGSRVWNTRLLGAAMGVPMPEGWFGSEQYRRFYGRFGIQEGLGFAVLDGDPAGAAPARGAVAGASGGALLTCFREVYGTEEFGERGLALLRMLLPALEAGVTTRARLAGAAATVEAALHGSRAGALIVGADGRRLYANPALAKLLAQDPERARIRAELDRAAAELRCSMLRTGPARQGVPSLAGASTELRTARARYRVWTTLLGEHLAGPGPAVLVQVERLTPEQPSLPVLRERWGFTRQEARVARLLARGRTNRQIAAVLRIRETTARHYTEAVFQKLGVHSRAEAAARILGG